MRARTPPHPSDCVLGIFAALDDLLLSGSGPAQHERARLLASCIQPRLGHFARTVPAEVGKTEFADFDYVIRACYLQALHTHVSPHLYVSAILSLPTRAGGDGLSSVAGVARATLVGTWGLVR
jgi:hypothetical protein